VPVDDALVPLAQFVAAARTGDLLVAELAGSAVGFALLGRLGADAHLREIDVLPACAGAGVGSELLEAACRRASTRGAHRMVLTTFRDVAFNAPWYARHGFVELADGHRGASLDAILSAEIEAGLARSSRCAMARCLQPSP
jgi:GNAT superfamily N-acetyltransferase